MYVNRSPFARRYSSISLLNYRENVKVFHVSIEWSEQIFHYLAPKKDSEHKKAFKQSFKKSVRTIQ